MHGAITQRLKSAGLDIFDPGSHMYADLPDLTLGF